MASETRLITKTVLPRFKFQLLIISSLFKKEKDSDQETLDSVTMVNINWSYDLVTIKKAIAMMKFGITV